MLQNEYRPIVYVDTIQRRVFTDPLSVQMKPSREFFAERRESLEHTHTPTNRVQGNIIRILSTMTCTSGESLHTIYCDHLTHENVSASLQQALNDKKSNQDSDQLESPGSSVAHLPVYTLKSIKQTKTTFL